MGLESFISGSGIASKALDYVDTAVQYFNQKKLNRQAQSDTQENMQLQKDLNLQQVSDSYAASVRGMRKAGINPALAVGGTNMAQGVSSHPGNAGTAAKPENSLPAALEAGVALAQQKSQLENLEANTDLQKEETREKKISNDRKESEDYVINEHLPHLIEYMKQNTDDEFTLGWIDEFSQNSKNLLQDKGTLDAFQNIFFEMTRQNRNKALDELTNAMDISVMKMQLTNGTAAALADLPKANRRLIYKNMLRMDAEIARFNAETRNVQEDTKFFEERRQQTAATVAKLGQETLAILHGDKVALYDAGEIGALGLTLGFDAVNNFANGVGFGTGVAVAGKVVGGKGAGMAGGSRLTGGAAVPKFASDRLETIKKAKDVGMPKETYQEIVRRADAYAKGDPVKRAQMINKGVEFWNKNQNNPKYK